MAASFEQQFALYDQILRSTQGKKAESLIENTKLLLTEWQDKGVLTQITLSLQAWHGGQQKSDSKWPRYSIIISY